MKAFVKNMFLLVCCLMVMHISKADAVIVTNMVEIRLSIEDADMKGWAVTNVKFDCKDIDISKKTFMNRVVRKVFNISPGTYELEWTIERSENPWGGKETSKERRMIVFELTDAVVHLVIRGNTLVTY
jgi:hypothetical protein